MNKHQELFLTELAELMEKHCIDFNIEERHHYFESYVVGIEVSQESIYDDQNELVRDCSYLTLPTCFDSKDILTFIKENSEDV